MSWKFVLSLIFALIVAVFAIQNADAVAVKFLIWDISVSQALIVLISAIFGALAVALIGMISQMRLKSTIRSDKKEIASLQGEIASFKSKLDRNGREAATDVADGTAPVVEGEGITREGQN